MNKSLPRDPRVVRISSALKADRLRTCGGLLSAWCIADEQTEDGKLDGYTPDLLDELIGFPGLALAMQSVGWLEVGDGFLVIPRFEEHNGQSAKRRAQDSARKMSAREADICPQPEPTICGPEKRREEKIKKSMAKPLIEEVAAFCKSIGLPESDGNATFWKWESNDWMNGKKPIKNWKATIRQWNESGWLPSQKNPTTPTGTRPVNEQTKTRSLFD